MLILWGQRRDQLLLFLSLSLSRVGGIYYAHGVSDRLLANHVSPRTTYLLTKNPLD